MRARCLEPRDGARHERRVVPANDLDDSPFKVMLTQAERGGYGGVCGGASLGAREADPKSGGATGAGHAKHARVVRLQQPARRNPAADELDVGGRDVGAVVGRNAAGTEAQLPSSRGEVVERAPHGRPEPGEEGLGNVWRVGRVRWVEEP